jgi:hypothetical protein
MTITFTPIKEDTIKRDRWGRPLIEPVGGGKPIAYTRVSTLAKALDNKDALMKWKQRQTVIGLGKRPDLANMASAVDGDNRKLDDIVEQAMAAAESDRAANIGTTLHWLTEHVDAGTMPDNLPAEHVADLDAYEVAMKGIEIVGTEQFIVCDEVMAAGTFDRLVRLPDGRVMVADIKTGQHEPKYPHSATVQISVYAHGHLYDPERGRLGYLPDLGVSTDEGLLIHLPAGKAQCDLYILDLTVGWHLARTAVVVRDIFKAKPLTPYAPTA